MVVALLAGEPSFVSGIPQHSIGSFDMEPGRDDHGEPGSKDHGEVIHIYIHIDDSAPSARTHTRPRTTQIAGPGRLGVSGTGSALLMRCGLGGDAVME